ncbi:MAG: YccF domain-containing protein [Cyanobacteria bacterium P01_D01_bin.123]
MTFLANVLWVIFGGLILALEYWIGGLLLCLTIVGIPFGLQAFKLGSFAFLPFGKRLRDRPAPGLGGAVQLVLNILWLVLIGLPIALTHIAAAVGCAITIIGIPFAIQHFKMVPLALLPFGKDWVEAGDWSEI